MSMTDPVFQWLAYELAAIFAILFIWVLLRARRKQKRTQAAAASKAKLLKNSYEQRVAALSSQLSTRYGLSGAALDSMVDELMLREKEIFKSIVNLYTQQDEKTLNNLPEQITALTDATISIMEADAEQEITAPELLVEEADDSLVAEEVDEPETSEANEAEAEADIEFDGVFDDSNAETFVAQTEMLDDESELTDAPTDAEADFAIELADIETEEVDVDDIFNQNQPIDEPVVSDEQDELAEATALAESELDIDPDLLAEFDGLAEAETAEEFVEEPVVELEPPQPAPRKISHAYGRFFKE